MILELPQNLLQKVKSHYTKFLHKKEWNKLEYNYYDKVDNVISIIKENFDSVDYYIKKSEYKTFIYFRNEEDLTYIKLIEEKKESPIPHIQSLSGGMITGLGSVTFNHTTNQAFIGTSVLVLPMQISCGTSYNPNQPLNSAFGNFLPFLDDDF